MSERIISVSFKSASLAEALDVMTISELCYAIIKRILSHYSSVTPDDSPVHVEIYRFLSNLHSYFCTLGMIPFFHGTRSRMAIQCITLLYNEHDDMPAPVSFQGVTVFQDLLENHPKMVLDFAIEAMIETIKAIRIKIDYPIGPEDFIDRIRTICGHIRSLPRIAPLMVPHQGTPFAIIRLRVFPP